MISSVPPPIGPSRGSRAARAMPVLLHVAGAAVDLQAGVGGVEGGALRRELRHRHLLHGVRCRRGSRRSAW